MNKLSIHAIAFIGFIILLGIAGRYDYNSIVIYEMPKSTYEYMSSLNFSESEMVDEYQKDRKYWDSIAEGYNE